MKTFTLLLTATFFIIYTSAAIAQPEQKPFKGTYVNDEHQFSLTLNLYENDLEAPGFSFLGKMGGYLHGRGIYGTWFLTEHHIKGKKATLRMSNDSGSDAQTIEFTQLTDSTFSYRTIGGNEIKKAKGQKLVKTASQMIFKRTPYR